MKQWYECNKCGSKNSLLSLRVKEKGPHLGLYCSCGAFIKWANEEERNAISVNMSKIVLNAAYGALSNKDAMNELKYRHQLLTQLEYLKIQSKYYALPEPDSAECFKIVEV